MYDTGDIVLINRMSPLFIVKHILTECITQKRSLWLYFLNVTLAGQPVLVYSRCFVVRKLLRALLSWCYIRHFQECKVTDQKQTGRCWIFAALNVMRLGVMETLNLADDFELVSILAAMKTLFVHPWTFIM